MTTFDLAASYRRPDLDAAAAEARAFAAAAGAAASGEELVAVTRRWDAARRRLDTLKNVASVRYQQDTRDPQAKAEEDFWNDASPLLRELDELHARALLDSRHRGALDAAFGPQLLRLKQCQAQTFAPAIRDAIAEEARLGTQYTELTAQPGIEFRGQAYSLSGIARWFVDGDRQTRLEAHQARDRFLARHGVELDAIYHRLVGLRDGMSRALGHERFTPLGYLLMSRTGWGPRDAAVFRDEIRREAVPLVADLVRAQARRLGVDRLLYHDEAVSDPRGNPRPLGGVGFCLDAARAMFDELGPAYGEFFRTLEGRRHLDLDLREGKAGGGFCTQFAELGVPFVFANFNGTEDDVRVLTHECGHAFQAWRSRSQPLLEYLFPTYEACEVHSMSMEYLVSPWMDRFFGAEEAARARRIHLERELAVLPYMAAVDHFQHEVYQRPGLAASERHALWREMERTYLPWRDYGGLLPYLERGGIWQRQLHVYLMPFYYLDYALAQTCALQLWARAEEDRPRALADYLALCEAGGAVSFDELVGVGRLRSPFEAGCLGEVCRRARRALDL